VRLAVMLKRWLHGPPYRPVRFRAFLRKARQAAHQALYFAEVMAPIGDGPARALLGADLDEILDEEINSSAGAISGICDSVAVPWALYNDSKDNTGSERKRRPECRAAVVDAVALWVTVIEEVDGLNGYIESPRAQIKAVQRACHAFLRGTASESSRHEIFTLFAWSRRNLASILAALAVAYILLALEAIRSLVSEDLLFFTVFTGALALGPSLLLLRAHRRGDVPAWDLGGRPFRRLARMAVPPERGVTPFPRESLLAPRLGRSVLLRLGLNVTWTVAVVALTVAWNKVALALSELALPQGLIALEPLLQRLAPSGTWGSVAALICLLLVVLTIGRLIDFWDFLSPQPARLVLLLETLGVALAAAMPLNSWPVVLALLLVTLLHVVYSQVNTQWETSGRVWLWTGGGSALLALFFGVRAASLDELDPRWRVQPPAEPSHAQLPPEAWLPPEDEGPIVLMTASGGGSRAAIFTALTLEALHRDFSSSSRALPAPTCRLRAISSVSGGSLTTAAYAARRLSGLSCAEPIAGAQSLVAAVDDDFLWPTFWGMVDPTSSRGAAIEAAWEGSPGPGLGDATLGDLAASWRAAATAIGDGEAFEPPPLPLFNSATLSPNAVVLSPLTRDNYTQLAQVRLARGDAPLSGHAALPNPYDDPRWVGMEAACGDERPPWVFFRDGIYGLEDLLPSFDPRLTQAVRASANFPFGFPLVEIETSEPLYFSARREDRWGAGAAPHCTEGLPVWRTLHGRSPEKPVFLTDGGVLSNSGMWTLYQLMLNHSEALQRRGVLLLMVEASHLPEVGNPIAARFQDLAGSFDRQEPLGQGLHRRMLEHLKACYGDRLAVAQVSLPANAEANLPTTWALPRAAVSALSQEFELAWSGRHQQQIDRIWRGLHSLEALPEDGARECRPLDARLPAHPALD